MTTTRNLWHHARNVLLWRPCGSGGIGLSQQRGSLREAMAGSITIAAASYLVGCLPRLTETGGKISQGQRGKGQPMKEGRE